MKLGSLIAGSLFVLAAGAANADFLIVNNTSSTISSLYLSDSKVDDWEEDLLEELDPLGPGDSLTVGVDVKYNVIDLRVETPEGVSVDYFGIPGSAKKIQLNPNAQAQYE